MRSTQVVGASCYYQTKPNLGTLGNIGKCCPFARRPPQNWRELDAPLRSAWPRGRHTGPGHTQRRQGTWSRVRYQLSPELDEHTPRRAIASRLGRLDKRVQFVTEDAGERLTASAELSVREHIAAGD